MLKVYVYLRQLQYRLTHDRRGVTALEYGLIASLIALMIIGGATNVGKKLQTIFDNINTALNTTNGT